MQNEELLHKVFGAILNADVDGEKAYRIISEIERAGILFTEGEADSMTRNAFENNDRITTDDLDGDVRAVLPKLEEDEHYDFETLSDGRTAVVVQKDEDLPQQPVRDKFGRKYAGQ